VKIRLIDLVYTWLQHAQAVDLIDCDDDALYHHFEGYLSGVVSGGNLQPGECNRLTEIDITIGND